MNATAKVWWRREESLSLICQPLAGNDHMSMSQDLRLVTYDSSGFPKFNILHSIPFDAIFFSEHLSFVTKVVFALNHINAGSKRPGVS